MDTILAAIRIIERIAITASFLGIVIFLIYVYRNDVLKENATLKAGPVEITSAVTLPVVLVLIFVGYAHLSLSHPVEWQGKIGNKGSEQPYSFRLFEGADLPIIFTSLARNSDLQAAEIVKAQEILLLSMKADELMVRGKFNSIEELLGNSDLPFEAIRSQINQLYNESQQ